MSASQALGWKSGNLGSHLEDPGTLDGAGYQPPPRPHLPSFYRTWPQPSAIEWS